MGDQRVMVDDPPWHAKKTRIWNLVLSRDPAMRVFFDEHENPLDEDQAMPVQSVPQANGELIFLRRIRRAKNSESKTHKVIASTDKKGRKFRSVVVELPKGLERTNILQLPAGYDRIFDRFDDEKNVAIAKIAEAQKGKLAKIGDDKDKEAALKAIVDKELGKTFENAAVEMAMAINLYHELIHMRLRFEFDGFWPSDQQTHKEAFLKWADPDQSPRLRKAYDKLVAAHDQQTVIDWLEEKYAGNQSFAVFDMWEFNEELAKFYTRLTKANPEHVCELFDALDEAHGVPTSGRDPAVKVDQFVRVIGERRDNYYDHNKQSLTPKQYRALFDYAKKRPPWDPKKQITFEPGLPKGTLKPVPRPVMPARPKSDVSPIPPAKETGTNPDLGAVWRPPADYTAPPPPSFASRWLGFGGINHAAYRPPILPTPPRWKPSMPPPYRPPPPIFKPPSFSTYKPPAPPPFKPIQPLPPMPRPIDPRPSWSRGPIMPSTYRPPPFPTAPNRLNPLGHPWDPGSWNPMGRTDPASAPWRPGGGINSPFHPSGPPEPYKSPFTGPLQRDGPSLGSSWKYPGG